MVDAIKPAACSCRVRISLIDERDRESRKSSRDAEDVFHALVLERFDE